MNSQLAMDRTSRKAIVNMLKFREVQASIFPSANWGVILIPAATAM
jgi:hypothetical protein